MGERRHKFTVFHDVLNCCSPGQQQQSNITRRTNLNLQYWGQIKAELLNNGLLSFQLSRQGPPGFKRYNHQKRKLLPEQKFYSTTPKGFEFIRKYHELLTLSAADVTLQVAE